MNERHFGLKPENVTKDWATAARMAGLDDHAHRARQAFVLSEGDRNRILAMGLVASTLYLVGVFVAGLVWQRYDAVLLALVTTSFIYASAFVQFWQPMGTLAMFLTGWSVAFGIAAGVSLIW